MRFEKMNTYRLTHYNGDVENLNAKSMEQAIENMQIAESVSAVVQAVRVADNIDTIVADIPDEVQFQCVVSDGETESGCVATPASGTIHTGDMITLEAVPARNYAFKAWKRNGIVISNTAKFEYTMTELPDGETLAVFTAEFALAPVNWSTAVSPAEATGEGCVGFPLSGTTEANANLSVIAVAKGGYTFDHWERNGVSLGTNEILTTTAEPLAEGETSAVYTAVFTEA